jgi:hypothetical protein
MKANRTSVGSLLLLIVGCVFIIAAETLASAQTTKQTKANQSSQTAAATEALKASFGSALEAVTAFNPFYLTGDFNGDGAQDIVIVTRIKGRRGDLPPDVKVLNPFEGIYPMDQPAYPADPAAKPTLAFAIIHGTNAGWKTSPSAGKFLVVGESPILIMNYERAKSGRPQEAKDLMQIMSKRGKRRRGATWPPAAARGDSIILETEAINSILYWNGKTYRWEESEGGE